MTPTRDQDTSQIFADFFSSMVSDSHALGLQPVERTDHLQVERWADPHCVGIDQFLANVGALSFALADNSIYRIKVCVFADHLVNQYCRFLTTHKEGRLVLGFPASRLVQIVEAVTTSVVLSDRQGIDGDNLGGD